MSGTRSAALRKLNQYEDCLKDIARAAKFGYPKASIYKLWERKGKCYEVEFQTRVYTDFTITITEKASTKAFSWSTLTFNYNPSMVSRCEMGCQHKGHEGLVSLMIIA